LVAVNHKRRCNADNLKKTSKFLTSKLGEVSP
jgi:hypothetical protein